LQKNVGNRGKEVRILLKWDRLRTAAMKCLNVIRTCGQAFGLNVGLLLLLLLRLWLLCVPAVVG
jgi:hypothetical protein